MGQAAALGGILWFSSTLVWLPRLVVIRNPRCFEGVLFVLELENKKTELGVLTEFHFVVVSLRKLEVSFAPEAHQVDGRSRGGAFVYLEGRRRPPLFHHAGIGLTRARRRR